MSPRHARPAADGAAPASGWRSALGLLPAVLVALGGSVAFAAAAPPYGSADEAAHVDYAWRVWHGALPVFEDGLRLTLEQGTVPPVQWTAQHPPLFYALMAPVVGPLLDADRPVAAAFAARGVTAVLAVLLVLAVAWATRWVLGRGGRVAAAAVTVAAAGVWVLRLGGAVYNDVLLVLVVTLLLGTAARIVRLGRVTWPWWVLWSVLPCAAALTRASGLPLAALALGVVGVAALLRRGDRVRSLLLGVLLPAAVAVAGAGWFYVRNARLTGTWTGSQPEWAAAHLDRVHHPVQDVLVSRHFWVASYRQLGYAPGTGDLTNLALLVVPVLVAVVLLVVALVRRRVRTPDVLVGLLLVGAVAGITLQQALYTAQGGGVNGRYLAVLVLPMAVAVAVALTAWRRTGVVVLAVAVWAGLRGADLVADVRTVVDRFRDAGLPSLPADVAWVGLGVALAGLAAWVVSAAVTRDVLPRDGSDPAAAPAPVDPAPPVPDAEPARR